MAQDIDTQGQSNCNGINAMLIQSYFAACGSDDCNAGLIAGLSVLGGVILASSQQDSFGSSISVMAKMAPQNKYAEQLLTFSMLLVICILYIRICFMLLYWYNQQQLT
jgi:hypothetical protein